MRQIHVNGWYERAGAHLLWPSEVGITGVAIAPAELRGIEEAEIVVAGRSYRLDVRRAAIFCNTRGSYRRYAGTRACARKAVIPRTFLEPLEPPRTADTAGDGESVGPNP